MTLIEAANIAGVTAVVVTVCYNHRRFQCKKAARINIVLSLHTHARTRRGVPLLKRGLRGVIRAYWENPRFLHEK